MVVFNGRDAGLRRPDSAARRCYLQIDTLPDFRLSKNSAGRKVQTVKRSTPGAGLHLRPA
jgi:hypothetical protein